MAVFGVSPNGQRWQVTREGVPVSVHLSRAAAVDDAQRLAEQEGGRVVVVDEHRDTTAVLVTGHGSAEPEGRASTDVPDPNEAR
jgi:hypothetical protein